MKKDSIGEYLQDITVVLIVVVIILIVLGTLQ